MSDYWAERISKAQTTRADKNIFDIDKQMQKYYKTAMKRAIADFEATYDKLWATVNLEGREPTPADLYKLDKYWQMQGQLQKELQLLGDREAEMLSRKFTKAYKDFYDNMALPSGSHFGLIDTEVAEQMINQIWCADGKSWSARVWKSTEKLAETLNDELIDSVVTGRDTKDLVKRLTQRFKVSYSEAQTLVQTEIAHIQTQAARKRYKDAGIEWVQVWADEDERRCKDCGDIHQKRYRVTERMPVPVHPRCRCCIVPVIE